MELRHYRYFVAVAERLNFSQAAQVLHVAQPALSRAVHDIEDEIGVALFLRNKPHIQLTAAGLTFLEEARRVLAQAQEAVELTRKSSRGEVGELNLAYVATLSDGLIPRLLRRFRAEFPTVSISMTQMPPAQQLQALLGGQIHIGFIGLPLEEKEEKLEFHVFRDEPLCVALPKVHAFKRQKELTLQALARERFIFLSRAGSPSYYDWLLKQCRRAGFRPQIAQEAESAQTCLELVAAGFGVALFPKTAHQAWYEDVVFRELTGESPIFRHSVAWRRGAKVPAVEAFLKLLDAETGVPPGRKA
jgi:DNA-binding transcriptional LysR family regulator